jgi:hypothetical protein
MVRTRGWGVRMKSAAILHALPYSRRERADESMTYCSTSKVVYVKTTGLIASPPIKAHRGLQWLVNLSVSEVDSSGRSEPYNTMGQWTQDDPIPSNVSPGEAPSFTQNGSVPPKPRWKLG